MADAKRAKNVSDRLGGVEIVEKALIELLEIFESGGHLDLTVVDMGVLQRLDFCAVETLNQGFSAQDRLIAKIDGASVVMLQVNEL
jgi:hypothetical protein